jgi:hypothetical protein
MGPLKLAVTLVFFTVAPALSAATDPADVCREIVAKRPSLADACRRLLSVRLDEATLRVSLRALKSDPSIAVQVLHAGANRSVATEAGELCEDYVYFHPWNAGPCIDAVANRRPSPEILRIARLLIQKKDGHLALDVLRPGEVTDLDPGLVPVCEGIAARTPELAERCVRVIAGKRGRVSAVHCGASVLDDRAKLACLSQSHRFVTPTRTPARTPATPRGAIAFVCFESVVMTLNFFLRSA